MAKTKSVLDALSWADIQALKALERKAHKWAEDFCNLNLSNKTVAHREAIIMRDIKRIFGTVPKGFFFNGDPRGYALKIDPKKGSVEGLTTDWGGYGLLAAPENFERV